MGELLMQVVFEYTAAGKLMWYILTCEIWSDLEETKYN